MCTAICEVLASENKNVSCDGAICLATIFKIANNITLLQFPFLVSVARTSQITVSKLRSSII